MERFGNSAGDTKITVTKTMEQALKECEKQFNRTMSDKDPSTTYWVDIGYNDENDFAVVMCYMDEDSAESYGYDGESDFVQAKFAYCPRNSMMNEYEWDWLMPYPVNEYGDTLDTDMSIYSADSSDFGWILDEGYKFIDEFNANLPADEDDWDDFDDEDSDLYEAKETDGAVKFYYKGNLVGTCDADYIDCDAVYELMKKDKTASTAVLNYLNSLGDPVFPVSDEDWKTAETNVDNVDIEDLYYWFMKELGYEADEYDEGLNTEFDGWEIFADEGENDLYEGCHGGKKKKKKKVLNQKKVCGEDAPRTGGGVTYWIDDNASPKKVNNGLVDYTLAGYIDEGEYDKPCEVGFYNDDDEPAYLFVSKGVSDDGYEWDAETIEL